MLRQVRCLRAKRGAVWLPAQSDRRRVIGRRDAGVFVRAVRHHGLQSRLPRIAQEVRPPPAPPHRPAPRAAPCAGGRGRPPARQRGGVASPAGTSLSVSLRRTSYQAHILHVISGAATIDNPIITPVRRMGLHVQCWPRPSLATAQNATRRSVQMPRCSWVSGEGGDEGCPQPHMQALGV